MDAHTQARGLLSLHGRRASQIVVDEMVAAIRRGDDSEATRCQTVLRELETMLLGPPSSDDQAGLAKPPVEPPHRG